MKHFVTFFALFLLLTACSSLKYSVEGKSPSPYVGKWLWEPDGEKGVSCLYIGERGDSLFIAVYAKLPYGWLFIPGYYGNPANEIYSPYICMPRPEKEIRLWRYILILLQMSSLFLAIKWLA